jgi:hypothetical protein
MKKLLLIASGLVLVSVVHAQEPTEERKIWALKRAYELNGNNMVRWGSIDLSKEQPGDNPVVVKTIPIVPDKEKKK